MIDPLSLSYKYGKRAIMVFTLKATEYLTVTFNHCRMLLLNPAEQIESIHIFKLYLKLQVSWIEFNICVNFVHFSVWNLEVFQNSQTLNLPREANTQTLCFCVSVTNMAPVDLGFLWLFRVLLGFAFIHRSFLSHLSPSVGGIKLNWATARHIKNVFFLYYLF